jgi:hypothetical protein
VWWNPIGLSLVECLNANFNYLMRNPNPSGLRIQINNLGSTLLYSAVLSDVESSRLVKLNSPNKMAYHRNIGRLKEFEGPR